jgi:hypothetical protein
VAFPIVWRFQAARLPAISGIPGLVKSITLACIMLVVTSAFYFFIIPRLWFSGGAGAGTRAGIRIVVHPLLWEAAFLFHRMAARRWDDSEDQGVRSRLALFVMPVTVLSGVWGRILISSSGSLLVTLGISLVVGILEVSLRLSSGFRDKIVIRLIKGAEAANAMHRKSAALRANLILLDLIVEQAAVISSSITQYELGGAGSSTHSGGRLVLSIFVQLAIEIFVGAACIIFEERQGVPITKVYRERFRAENKTEAKTYVLGVATLTAILFFFFILTYGVSDGGFRSFDKSEN